MDPHCKVEDIPAETLKKLAPILLGGAAWRLLAPTEIKGWGDFVDLVEARFGVNRVSQQRTFKALRPTAEETGYQFVRRVEDLRRQLGKTPEQTLDAYSDKLPPAL